MRETYQQCNICDSTDIEKHSEAMGVHICRSCGSGASISWKERDTSENIEKHECSDFTNPVCPPTETKIGIVLYIIAAGFVIYWIYLGCP